MFVQMLAMLAACIVMVHTVCVASSVSRKAWEGHALQFAGIAFSYALVAGGSLGVVLRWAHGPEMLLFGVAGWIVFDRRNRIRCGRR